MFSGGALASAAGPAAEPGHSQGAAANGAPAAPVARPSAPVETPAATNTPATNNGGGGQPRPGAPTPLVNTPPVQSQTGAGGRNTAANNGNNAGVSKTPASVNQQTQRRDHEHDGNRNQQNFYYGYPGYYYGDVWAPYGWNDGDSSYNYPEFTYDNSNATPSNATDTTNTSNTSNTNAVAQPVTPVQSQSGQTAAGAAAQATNAVDKSPQMIAANNAVASAQQAYNSERERVLAALRDQPEYKDAIARKHAADAHVTDAKAEHQSQPAVVGLATAKMDAGDEVTKMQEQAIATDPAASAAKSKLNAAIADRDALRANLMAGH